jgi:hypothetical protein
MKKGEVIPDDVSVEDEKSRIDMQNPMNLD